MNYANYDDALQQLTSYGLLVDSGRFPNEGQRVRCELEGARQKKRGWYQLHGITIDNEHYLVGAFGYWQGDDNHVQKIELRKQDGAKPRLTDEQKKAIEAQRKEAIRRAEQETAQMHARAAKLANAAWVEYAQTGACDYLNRKNISAPAGIRYGTGTEIAVDGVDEDGKSCVFVAPNDTNSIIIPMQDADMRIHGLHIIRGDKNAKLGKQFWPSGMSMKGKFFKIGQPTGVVLVAEGVATAMTLHMATGLQVIVAFSANNLMPAALECRKRAKSVKLLICADDDYLTEGNPGCKNAEAAAIAVGGAWIKPEFPAGREGKKLTDFNDLANFPNCSISTVFVQISDKLTALGWGTGAARSADAPQVGGGDRPQRGTLKSLLQVDEAVERYSLIYGAGGTMYDHQESALIPKSDVLDICVDHAWREWKLHPARSVVRLSEVGFDPTEKDANILCNLWGGWPTTPKAGQCEILLSLLRHLCSGEESGKGDEVYKWVLKWLALPIQKPGAKMKTALIFHGPQGAGKNLFFEAYAQIFGKYSRIVGQAEIDDKFNDWASGKLFMIADEVVARQELFHIKNKLKALITGETIRINPKNVAAHDERNHVNIVFLSNEKQPLVLEKDDRRFAVMWTPDKLSENYYADVAEEVANGGIEALHDYLLHYPLDGFNEHSKPPLTKSKQDLIDLNLGSIERFIDEWTGGETDYPVCPCLSEDLFKAYSEWCRRNGVMKPRELNQVLGEIAKMPAWEKKRMRVFSDATCTGQTNPRMVVIPPAQFYAEKDQHTPDKTIQQWVTWCVFGFKEALND